MGGPPTKKKKKGMSVLQLVQMFPTDEIAEAWFIAQRWPDGIRCPECDSDDIQSRKNRHPQPYRCRACRKDFSAKTGTIMHGSKLGFQTWVVAMWMFTTAPKGVTALRLQHDLGITYRAAWHLGHRLRECFVDHQERYTGPVQIDESYVGGLEANKRRDKRLNVGGGTAGKVPVSGMYDMATGEVKAQVLEAVNSKTITDFVDQRIHEGTKVYTDGMTAYAMADGRVVHSRGEYVQGQATTNGIESFWARLKRAIRGNYHQVSKKHLPRYVREMAARHNLRLNDTERQMEFMAKDMQGKRLTWKQLTDGEG